MNAKMLNLKTKYEYQKLKKTTLKIYYIDTNEKNKTKIYYIHINKNLIKFQLHTIINML